MSWSAEVTQRTVVGVGGVGIEVYGAGEGPLVVLSHGFPELAYSWRHQIPALVEAGYRVVAPDQRGYGASDRPGDIADYDIHHLTGDLIAVIDDCGAERAVLVGHDWGSMVVWQTALLHPGRVAGVVGMSVPFTPRSQAPPTAIWRQVFGEEFFYILYFQEPGVADVDLGRDPATTMRRLLAGMGSGSLAPSVGADAGFVDRFPEPDGLPSWLSAAEVDHYAAEFARTGFTGGINWYRNFDRNWELTPELADARVTMPSLFIGGSADPVLAMVDPTANLDALDDHRGNVLIEGAGHWVQQERPDEVNAALLAFLADLAL